MTFGSGEKARTLVETRMLRGEYLFYRLSGTSNFANNPVFAGFPILFTWSSTNTSVVRVAASYKFQCVLRYVSSRLALWRNDGAAESAPQPCIFA
jgi:hypothetical protein